MAEQRAELVPELTFSFWGLYFSDSSSSMYCENTNTGVTTRLRV